MDRNEGIHCHKKSGGHLGFHENRVIAISLDVVHPMIIPHFQLGDVFLTWIPGCLVVNCYITIENHHAINGKINDFDWAIFQFANR